MRLNMLGFVYTTKCNAECDMCCFSCSPKIEEKLPYKKVKQYIQEAYELKIFNGIGFTGGECFLYYDEIIKLVKFASEKNFYISISTNGFWASNINDTKRIIEELINAGCNQLTISVDEFHQRYIPITNIKNILLASRLKKIRITLGSVFTKSYPGIQKLLPELGELALNVQIIQAPCLPVGRALDKLNSNEYIYAEEIFYKKCTDLGALTIFPDGNCYPCCSQAGKTDPLFLGNILESSLKDIINNYKTNIVIRILETHGIEWFQKIEKANNFKFSKKSRYINLCDICNDYLKCKENFECFEPYIHEEKIKIVNQILAKKKKINSSQ